MDLQSSPIKRPLDKSVIKLDLFDVDLSEDIPPAIIEQTQENIKPYILSQDKELKEESTDPVPSYIPIIDIRLAHMELGDLLGDITTDQEEYKNEIYDSYKESSKTYYEEKHKSYNRYHTEGLTLDSNPNNNTTVNFNHVNFNHINEILTKYEPTNQIKTKNNDNELLLGCSIAMLLTVLFFIL